MDAEVKNLPRWEQDFSGTGTLACVQIVAAWPPEGGRYACMKLPRRQVISSVLLALIVLAVLAIRAWPPLFPK